MLTEKLANDSSAPTVILYRNTPDASHIVAFCLVHSKLSGVQLKENSLFCLKFHGDLELPYAILIKA